MLGLPPAFTGVLQDTASTATLVALLTARETRSQYSVNESGFPVGVRFTVYSSTETHSSIEKGVKIAGIGKNGLRKIRVDDKYAMIPEELEKAVKRDLADGCTPLCTVATIGTTGSTAIDPVRAIGEICRQYRIWYHVDAAYGGTALLVPEMRWMGDGLDLADSFVVNPHKWMFTNFDCSAYFVRDPAALVKTFEILPEYLKTAEDSQVNNYRDWGIQLGRRFRALKLWFVIRTYGVDGLCEKIREHLALALSFVRTVESAADFEILAPVQLTTVCFRYHPAGEENLDTLNALNAALLDDLNKSGRLFLTHTKLDGRMALRLVVSQTNVGRKHVEAAWELISSTARALSPTTTS
jgi:aromatic-L-amino-acid decarboxylase